MSEKLKKILKAAAATVGGPAVMAGSQAARVIDAKYGKKNSDYRAGVKMRGRDVPAMLLPDEMPPEMLKEEESEMDA